jgi:DNA repair protein RecN (Recombination protein N)
MLERLALELVDITGQHEHHSLLRPETHLELLDAHAQSEDPRGLVREHHARVRALREEHAALEAGDRERAAREDFLQFQLREIHDAALRPGEEEELTVERARLRSVGRLLAAAASGEEALYSGDGSASSTLAKVSRELSELAAIDPSLDALATRVEAARLEAEDVAHALSRYARGLSADPGRLQEVEDRLALLSRLRRKHGANVEEIIATGERLAGELERLSQSSSRLTTLAAEIAGAESELLRAARALSNRRRSSAETMSARVEAELRTLALGGARFFVSLGARAAGSDTLALGDLHVGAKGLDRVEFLFAPNPGEEARPLQRIVSGGELSRVTLALKNVLAARDPVGTYVFDEVDAGVGGAVGEVLGRKLREVSKHRQIICITHLPQIAAFADAHFLVEKRIADGRTLAEVRALDARSRKEELARMLGGVKITARTRAHAEEMLRRARG